MRPFPCVPALALVATFWGTMPTRANELANPGFESPPPATNLAEVVGWTGTGASGSVSAAFAHEGVYALQIGGRSGIVAQTVSASGHWKYVATVRALRPSTDTSGAHVASAWLGLTFLNATGGAVLAVTDSLPTNAARDTWHELRVAAPAPFATAQIRIEFGWTWNPYSLSNTASAYFDSASLTGSAPTNSDCGVLINPGFDAGPPGNASPMSWEAPEDILPWEPLSGTNNVFITQEASHDGDQCVAITFVECYVAQSFAAQTGMSYVLSGWTMTPTNQPMTASKDVRFVMIMEFFDGTNRLSGFASPALTTNDPRGVWVFSGVTGRAPHHAESGTLTGRVLLGIAGSFSNYNGTVFADSLCITPFSSPMTNAQSGALWNPGFEYSAPGATLEYIDNWQGFGNAGMVSPDYARSGDQALIIWWTETLVGQTWAATSQCIYGTSAYLMTPSNNAFRTTGSAMGIVILQYLDATGGVIASYASDQRLYPWSPTNAWLYCEAKGRAPQGTVLGRTLFGIVGSPGPSYGGVILFDDASQWSIPFTQTNGLLVNGSFDSGPEGECWVLSTNGMLPGWDWTGSYATFISASHALDGLNSFAVSFTESLLEQRFTAVAGAMYRVDGYVQAVASSQGWWSGASGVLMLEFFQGTNQTTYVSRRFRGADMADEWKRLSVVGLAPDSGSITGRVLVGMIEDPHAVTVPATYFDALSMSNVAPMDAYSLWKFNAFGDTNLPNSEPDDDYDADGFSNQDEKIVGSDAADASSGFLVYVEAPPSNGQCTIAWPSAPGRLYSVSRLTNLLFGETTVITSDVPATPPANTVTDAPPALPVYYRIGVTYP
jgi:hypothetical protein